MTTNLNYPKPVNPDDGCNWLPVILWRMNAGARARSRSVFVAAPRPVPVPGITPKLPKPEKAKSEVTKSVGRHTKTHSGTVIFPAGEKTVRLHETDVAWVASHRETYDKITGIRRGSAGHCSLKLDSIKPLKKTTPEVSAQQLVALMKGKTLSYQGILSAIKKHHPVSGITLRDLQKRISTMLASNHVGIIRHDDMPVPHFTLTSVDPRYYANSEKTGA
ncbi:TPA: hypothetical protein RQP16_003611 [Klebsiella michiganensis]|uniref:hypothetical protein n=1 Tax=Klebsiella michiganensis TaxID=1134687 RepID=UPI00101FDAFB|nr:hypothetical protein [Klebsiella michiganensis]MCW9598298.1 hypothetical protein [Klebsiella michiganensis]HDX9240082.1 hypothetical protein [Klebsiella michiganensis]